MTTTAEIQKILAEGVARGKRAAVATVVERSGPGPRGPGSQLVLWADGTMMGSVGGGILEGVIEERGRQVLDNGRPAWVSLDLGSGAEEDCGMVCGGKVRVLVDFIDGDRPRVRSFYGEILSELQARRQFHVVTSVRGTEELFTNQFLLREESVASSRSDISEELPRDLLRNVRKIAWRLLDFESVRYFVHPHGFLGDVYIFGCGHVAQQLAPLCRLVGFRVVVLDDREEFANRERFPSADEIRVLESFEGVTDLLPIDPECYLVIVTRGHRSDGLVLSQCLRTHAGYIGMMGSRKKRDAAYAALTREGFTEQDLQRVFCPIGLAIGAETPEEIAVSIVAQLIEVRANRLRRL
ncbi:MAG TPA: XdhC family protein [Syntrophobacteraceae bacterium]|nr:XdhC family protein [Syntrophobacteraceae bacterium]